ncbi:transposase IS4 family protein [mine drainage metagenome]|uniref:Transposase IS4 family protein n=1 Tax=mine drainage metagenome TaxID=410659 RepID=T0ZD76_9ZZZZ
MNTDFSDGRIMNDLAIKRVAISVDEVMEDDSTEDQRKLAEKRIYVAVYNRERETLDLKDLDDRINIVKKRMSEITDQKELKKSLGKLKSLVKFSVNDTALNDKRIDILKKLAGRFLIVTNTELPDDEIVAAYKEQWQIERSFRTIKSFLEIRPVYHRKSERIRAYVFVCVLSLLLSRMMEKLSGRTINSIRKDLSYLDVVPVTVEKREMYISSGSSEASDILKSFGLPHPDIRESAHT